ncbi:MAG TPA: polysaccharide biosynthesis C-terminal domain-containing protein [Acidobacteriaceae bacterium]|nr:polysaccharide biosynthesis C-terminal domain-containing protein [Acidobacteriaceae bacterium]
MQPNAHVSLIVHPGRFSAYKWNGIGNATPTQYWNFIELRTRAKCFFAPVQSATEVPKGDVVEKVSTHDTNSVQSTAKKRVFVSARKLAQGSGSRVVRLIIGAVIGFLLTPFMIHRLGAVNYGLWALAFAFIGYYSLLDLGLSTALFTHMSQALGADDKEEANRIYNTGMAAYAWIGCVVLLLTLIFSLGSWFSKSSHGHVLAIVLFICGVQTAISFPMRAPFGALNAGSHFDITAWLSIFGLILRSLATVIVLLQGRGVIWLAAANLLANIPLYIVALIAAKWAYPFLRLFDRRAVNRAVSKKLLYFGAPVIIGQLADRVRLQSDAIVVSMFLGIAAVAHYNVASTFVLYYVDGIMAIIGVFTPLLTMQDSTCDREGLRKTFFTSTQLAIGSAGFVAFGLIALGHPFIERWMGREYLDAYPVLVVLALATLFDMMHATASASFYATMHQNVYAVLNGTEAVLNLALSISLAPHYGMIGVAFGTLIPSFLIRTFVQPLVLERYVGISVREYANVTGRAFLAALLFLVAPAFLSLRLAKPQYSNILLAAVCSAILFAIPYWGFILRTAGKRWPSSAGKKFLEGEAHAVSGETPTEVVMAGEREP